MFKIWEAFNSSLLDDRLIEFVGELSEEHVAGTSGKAGLEGGAQWKDVGIWSETEWTMLVSKALGSMSTCDKSEQRPCQLTLPRCASRSEWGMCD
jgi:proteasome activator subunit 4